MDIGQCKEHKCERASVELFCHDFLQREGDQAPNKIPADIVFIIRDKPHPHFKREGSDLKYTCKISLKEVGQEFHDDFYFHSKVT